LARRTGGAGQSREAGVDDSSSASSAWPFLDVAIDRPYNEPMAPDAIQSAHIAVNPRGIELSDLVGVYEKAF